MANMKSLNRKLIKEIKKKGFLKNKRIINTFENTMRHDFLPCIYKENMDGQLVKYEREEYLKFDELVEYIYSDKSIVFHARNNIHKSSVSQPSLIASMLEMLDIKQGDKILEIGTGSGYNAALMASITGQSGIVFSTEIDKDISDIAKNNIENMGIKNLYTENVDGGFGLNKSAPFDRIIVTCATADITKYWIQQMNVGAKLICPLVTRGMEVIAELIKVRDNYLEGKLHHYVHFYQMGGQFTILTHCTYTKKELKTLNKIIEEYAHIDDEFTDEIAKMNNRELNDFFFYLSIHNKHSICYYDAELDEMRRGYGLFFKTSSESGLAIIFKNQLHIWGNPDAHYMLINEFEQFRKKGSPGLGDYRLKVYANTNDIYETPSDTVIARKNSATVFERV